MSHPIRQLFEKDPFHNYALEDWSCTYDPAHAEYYHDTFEMLVNRFKPKTIIEVGSWQGRSAIEFATLAPDAHIICVDTWLGGPEHWLNPGNKEQLHLINARPDVYHTFMCNILRAGVSDRVTPISNTSQHAFKILRRLNISAEMVYIDGSHEHDDVYRDLTNYWNLVKPGGCMFGDDLFHEAIRNAVIRFTVEKEITPDAFGGVDQNTFRFFNFRKEEAK